MAGTLSITGNIKSSEGSTDIINQALSVSVSYSQMSCSEVSVAASATNQSISLGPISADAKMLILVPTYAAGGDSELTARLNGGTEDIPFGPLLVLGGNSTGIDSITVSNGDATNAVTLKVYAA
jgi:hypothetical protein